jgi:prepilin-type N-terminal cleavage/methylation domain-containing protein/prepilin-type processing-associated H-X9-DG protein
MAKNALDGDTTAWVAGLSLSCLFNPSAVQSAAPELAPQPWCPAMRSPCHSRRPGFSIIELLVVIAIIGVLAGMLVPAAQLARGRVQKVACANNLRQLGIGITMYCDANNEIYPDAAQMPSVTPERPSLVTVLQDYVENNSAGYRCPADRQYYRTEGMSYEYPASRLAGRSRTDVTRAGRNGSDTIFVLYDFHYVHGNQYSATSRNVLYADGHVQ